MSAIRSYTSTTPTESSQNTEKPVLFEFELDGVPMTAVKPKDALIAQLAPVQSRRTNGGMKIKLALDFLGDCVQEPGRTLLENRLLDPNDKLDAEHVMPILADMGEFWKEQDAEQRAANRR